MPIIKGIFCERDWGLGISNMPDLVLLKGFHMPAKIFINIRDTRWNDYKIDFSKIVRTALSMALAEDTTENIIKKSNRAIAPWMSSVGMGEAFGKINREVSITLANDSEIQKLNKKYRGIDKPTNVLSFETGDAELLGDIYISFDTAMREARPELSLRGAERRGNLVDKHFTGLPRRSAPRNDSSEFIDHTAHLVVHGVLHLLSYDHMNDSDASTMEALEVKILAKLGIVNPYENSSKANFQRAKSKGPSGVAQRADISPKQKLLFALCSLVCGCAASLGFAPFNFWWATILGIGGMYYLIASRSDQGIRHKAQGIDENIENKKKLSMPYALCLMLFGAGYAAASFWWVLNSIYVDPLLAAQFAIWTAPGIIGIAIAGALIFSLPFFITNLCMRRARLSAAIRPVVFAASWTFVLWLREWLLTGFPWNPVANIALPFPWISNSMALWGALGLTFIIIGLTAAIADAIAGHKAQGIRHRYFSVWIFLILLIIGTGYGYCNIKKSAISNQQSAIIRIVQPAKSAEQKATHSREQAIANAEKNIEGLIELAGKAERSPDLIIFPETAYPFTIVQNRDDFPMARKLGIRTIIGAMSFDEGRFYNSMIIAGADGRIERIYSKSHLVPFGEYRPFGDIIPTPGQLSPGQGPEIIGTSDWGLGTSFDFVPAICYEIIFSDSLVPSSQSPIPSSQSPIPSPQAIVNITNDTWFGKTPGTYQHLDMARRQAIESGLPIVRANYSGISAFIAADGCVISSLPIGVAGVLDGTVSGAHMTSYRKIGRDLWMAIILFFSVLCIFARRKKS